MRVKKTRLTEAELVDQQVAPAPAQPATAEDVASAQSAMDGTMTDPNAVADPNGGVDDQNAMAEEPVMDGGTETFEAPAPGMIPMWANAEDIKAAVTMDTQDPEAASMEQGLPTQDPSMADQNAVPNESGLTEEPTLQMESLTREEMDMIREFREWKKMKLSEKKEEEVDPVEEQNKVQDEASKCLGKFGSCSVEYQDSDIHVEDGLKCIVISSSEPLVTDEISDALTDAGFGMVSFLPGVDPNDETKYLTKVVASANAKFAKLGWDDKEEKEEEVEDKEEDKSEKSEKSDDKEDKKEDLKESVEDSVDAPVESEEEKEDDVLDEVLGEDEVEELPEDGFEAGDDFDDSEEEDFVDDEVTDDLDFEAEDSDDEELDDEDEEESDSDSDSDDIIDQIFDILDDDDEVQDTKIADILRSMADYVEKGDEGDVDFEDDRDLDLEAEFDAPAELDDEEVEEPVEDEVEDDVEDTIEDEVDEDEDDALTESLDGILYPAGYNTDNLVENYSRKALAKRQSIAKFRESCRPSSSRYNEALRGTRRYVESDENSNSWENNTFIDKYNESRKLDYKELLKNGFLG